MMSKFFQHIKIICSHFFYYHFPENYFFVPLHPQIDTLL